MRKLIKKVGDFLIVAKIAAVRLDYLGFLFEFDFRGNIKRTGLYLNTD